MFDEHILSWRLATMDDMSSFLVTEQITRYDTSHPYIGWLPELIRNGGVKVSPITLPLELSADARRLGSMVCPPRKIAIQAVQWMIGQGYSDVCPEKVVRPYGKPDLVSCEHRIIVECGDTRTDKPITGMALGYSVMVVPYENGLPFAAKIAGQPCDGILFECVPDSYAWSWFVGNHEDVVDTTYAPAFSTMKQVRKIARRGKRVGTQATHV